MQQEHAGVEGGVTERLIKYYETRAEALGLIIVEPSYVSLNGQLSKRQLGIYDDQLVPGLKELVKRIQPFNTRIVLQLDHAGALASKILGTEPVSASAKDGIRELQIEEMETIVYSFNRAAERAINAGFDGVEINGAHGFLLNQFYSPITNQRTDEYGGSLDNRMRFPLEIVRGIRNQIGTRLLLYRLGAVDLAMMGTQIDDSKQFAKKSVEAGVDIVDISGGLCGASPELLAGEEGYFIQQAHEIRQVINAPVIGVGGIKTAQFANQVIHEDRVDFVGVGQALLQDSLWAVKTMKILKSK